MKTVTFSVSLGGYKKEETFELSYLGLIEEEFKTQREYEEAIDKELQLWIKENISSNWRS